VIFHDFPTKVQIKTFVAVSYNLGHLLHNSLKQIEDMGRWGRVDGVKEREADRQIGCLCHYMRKVM